jgi:high affinity Mn2+ porin
MSKLVAAPHIPFFAFLRPKARRVLSRREASTRPVSLHPGSYHVWEEAKMTRGNICRKERPASALPRSRAIISTASNVALCIGLILLRSSWARAQGGGDDSQGAKSEYERGYADGYKAGLRAAMTAKSAKRPENAGPAREQKTLAGESLGLLTNGGATAATASADPPAKSPDGPDLVPQARSLWAEMTTYDDNNQGTLFHHSQSSPFWLSAQANFVAQMHPRFNSPYRGPNSFNGAEEQAVSRVLTLFTGFQLNDTTELVLDAESSGWSGLSQAFGLAGYVNLDVVRNPELSAEPYLARLWLRKVIPLSDKTIEIERNPLSLLTTLPVRRIDIHVGKLSLPDFFDVNSVASDSGMQFLNWTVDNNGAWDYAADTRGYTYALVVDYEDRYWGALVATALEPTVANGLSLEWNPQRAIAENYEVDLRPPVLRGRSTVIRALAFTNFANMGDYHDAIDQFEENRKTMRAPNIDTHPFNTTLKYGFGLNLEQELTEQVRLFMRAGWNEGQHESWAYTEVDQTLSFGGDIRGDRWQRPKDKWGVAFVANGISRRHRQYLAHGGLGFLLGDGNLSYGPEEIMETYYNFPLPLRPGIFAAFDLQYINNPGYNRDRGPVIVPGVRLHIEM